MSVASWLAAKHRKRNKQTFERAEMRVAGLGSDVGTYVEKAMAAEGWVRGANQTLLDVLGRYAGIEPHALVAVAELVRTEGLSADQAYWRWQGLPGLPRELNRSLRPEQAIALAFARAIHHAQEISANV